jgi:SprT protein
MIIDKDSQNKIIDHANYWIEKIKSTFNIDVPTPTIDFNQRGTIAGQTIFDRNDGIITRVRISFNPYHARDNFKQFIEEIVPHEVAHVAQYVMHPQSKQHGVEWIDVMRKLGLPPKILTDLHAENPSSRVKNLYLYQCVECNARKVVGKKEHDSYEKKWKLPECEKCGGVMEFLKHTVL